MAEYIPCDIPVFHCKFLIMRRRNVLTYFWLLDSSHFITAAEVNLQLWGDRFFPSSTARASEKLNSEVSTWPFARWVACRIEGMSSAQKSTGLAVYASGSRSNFFTSPLRLAERVVRLSPSRSIPPVSRRSSYQSITSFSVSFV